MFGNPIKAVWTALWRLAASAHGLADWLDGLRAACEEGAAAPAAGALGNDHGPALGPPSPDAAAAPAAGNGDRPPGLPRPPARAGGNRRGG